MATPAMPSPAPEKQAEISTIGRMLGVLTGPQKTFADIARKPGWAGPFLLLCALSTIVGIQLGQKTDWRAFFERQNSQSSRFEQMPQDQKDRVIEQQTTWAPKISFAFGLLGVSLSVLVLALVYWAAFNLFTSAGLRFGQAFSITSHGFMPAVIASVLAIVTLFIKQRGDVDPEHFLVSNVAALLPDPSPKWLTTLGMSLDVFWVWSLVLFAMGFAAANPKKIKPGTTYGTVFGLWLLWVLVRVGWAAL